MRSARRLSSSSASRGAVAGEARPKHLSVSHFRLRLTGSTASAGVEIVPTALLLSDQVEQAAELRGPAGR